MVATSGSSTATVNTLSISHGLSRREVELPDYDRERIEDVGFLTAMTLVLLGNYAQTGHFGGPLAYTPYTVASHLVGPDLGGLRYDYRRPKHPYSDRFMLAGGHNAPVTYALWMILGEALARQHAATGRRPLLRRPGYLDAIHRRAGIPTRQRRARHHPPGQQPPGPPAHVTGRDQGNQVPRGTLRDDGPHQRCERRTVRHRHCHISRQSRFLRSSRYFRSCRIRGSR